MKRENLDEIEGLLQFCSPRQRDYLEGLAGGQTVRAVAKAEGVNERTVAAALTQVRRKAAQRGYAPRHGLTEPLPPGVDLERATIQRGGDGQIERVWTKAKTRKEQEVSLLLDRLDSGDFRLPQFKATKPPKAADENLATLLTITDFHLGMYAWEAETGDDWDMTIARDVFLSSIQAMCEASPKSGLGILNQLGDFLHWDGLLAVTPSSGHVLDADTRYAKLVDMTMEVMALAVKMMLKRFARVHVIQAEGNHDMTGSIWLRKYMKHIFANEPRVTVDDTEFPYYAYLHGDTMLGFHHGHKLKLPQLQKLFSSDPRYRAMWGRAKQAYLHTGHLHHEKVVEDGGAITEQHPTLAGRDAYAARGGWVSMRGAKVITYDKADGEIHRVTVRPRA